MSKMNSKYRRMALAVCMFITFIGYWLIFKDSPYNTSFIPEDLNPNIPSLELLFSFYNGADSIIPILLFFLVIPFISHFSTHILKTEKADRQIALRQGWKGYLHEEAWRSVKEIWYLPILTNGILILLIVCTVRLFPLTIEPYEYFHFYGNLILDIGIFTAFQVIGWILLNLLSLMFAILVSNKFLYPFLLLIAALGITFLISFLSGLPFGHEWILTALSPFHLLSPGVIMLIWPPNPSARIVTVFTSFSIYTIVVLVLFQFVLKREKTNG